MQHGWIVTSHSHDPWFNLALEEYLMRKLGKSLSGEDEPSAILFLWQNQNTVVIGRNQNAWAECKTAQLEEEGGILARRSTGGGAVFHDLGNLNFSLLLPESDFDLNRNFQMIIDTVYQEGIQAERSGRNDILVNGLKFSGNAFRLSKGVGLHHGTFLVHSHFERVARYLTVLPSKLASKGVTSVRSRVTNLQAVCPDLTVERLSAAMEKSFISTFCKSVIADNNTQNIPVSRFTEQDFKHEAELIPIYEQFSSWDWRYGQSIQFDFQTDHKFDWGHIQIGLNIHRGIVSKARIFSDALDCDFIDNVIECLIGRRFRSDDLADAVLENAPEGDGFGVSRIEMTEDIACLLRTQGW